MGDLSYYIVQKNQLILDMEKITVFRGVINGQEFNNVKDYNARMNELIEAGVEDINASSSTSVKTVATDEIKSESGCANTAKTYDEDASYYPYMDAEDPYYLDLLVTEDPAVNAEALNTMDDVLNESYRYITDTLIDPKVNQMTRREYLLDVQDILRGFKDDSKNTKKTLDSIIRKQADLKKELEALENAENILRAALPVIEKLDEFYKAVEADTLRAIAHFNSCDNTNKNDKCNCDGTCAKCTCGKDNGVQTDCKENAKTQVYDLNSIIDTIFGEGFFGKANNLKRHLS